MQLRAGLLSAVVGVFFTAAALSTPQKSGGYGGELGRKRKIGVTRATVSRWVNHDVDFFTALNRLRSDMHKSHGDRLRSLATKAYDVLEEMMGEETPPNLRCKAALAVIEAAKGIEGEVGHTSRRASELETAVQKLPIVMSLYKIEENFLDHVEQVKRDAEEERNRVDSQELQAWDTSSRDQI